jgi:nucleoside-diphosphate-sugar epimerase
VLFPYRRHARGPEDLLYSYEKILVERAANAWTQGATTVLRLPMVYGPNDRQRRVARYVDRLRGAVGRMRLNAAEASWRCTRGYVEDVAAAISLAALNEAAAGHVFNLGERETLTELEWVRAIATAIGWDGELLGDPGVPPSQKANWNADLIVDTGRIRNLLRYDEFVGPEEALRRAVASVALESG